MNQTARYIPDWTVVRTPGGQVGVIQPNKTRRPYDRGIKVGPGELEYIYVQDGAILDIVLTPRQTANEWMGWGEGT